ncbi:outer membrane beta-barrel protein [Chryseobacterium sp. NRRL B-14859]|uniref:outer membrane beta-barrel protein n=1 Tax=unclassified Chryseobacterium TaxID=2593645 RepID=UPI000F457009|nr:outer membrane beta-barrel protein [Chryseobacterium sp. G0240]ROI05563.1 porin family protein [Chryseobacterium sp. G0240]
MKKNLVIAAIAVFGMMSAQKNTLLLGGNIGYTSDNTSVSGKKSEVESFSFTPTVGYQFSDHWTVGINSTITSGKKPDDLGTLKENSFAIGPFVRYAVPLSQTFAVYGDLGAGYQNMKDTYTIAATSSERKMNGFYANFTPALFINFKNGFGLNFNIGGIRYGYLKDSDADLTNNRFNFSFGKEVGVGISKNFGLK